ncbi:hypothetical protein [Calothrix sp. CCY 0018]
MLLSRTSCLPSGAVFWLNYKCDAYEQANSVGVATRTCADADAHRW